ncbi:MAG: bifunctional DNA-formamidopyrimidine glycosylase/DNA-(apurinic or apyrimidinic site) lyase [Caldilineales bacterium]|nr:bifunctional DNA-formamidopyrimidine glycosylase/DNA-(apurinic or apyrimidinic site) lyase [Caldilineales bacterium]
MPELPEVQTILDALEPLVVDQPISSVTILWPGVVERPGADEFQARMRGRRVLSTGRRGKYMLFNLDDASCLVMHLRMTGEMRVVPAAEPYHKHDRLAFRLADGQEWRFKDQRKFGRAYLVEDSAEIVGKLGPEPLAERFTGDFLRGQLSGRTAAIKSLLLDQRIVAGIGNIYADEALFRARLHPQRQGGSLTPSECDALAAAVKAVIRQALAELGTTLRDYRRPDGSPGEFQNSLQVFQRTGEPCPSCGTPISRIVVGGRSTHFCPKEQVISRR